MPPLGPPAACLMTQPLCPTLRHTYSHCHDACTTLSMRTYLLSCSKLVTTTQFNLSNECPHALCTPSQHNARSNHQAQTVRHTAPGPACCILLLKCLSRIIDM